MRTALVIGTGLIGTSAALALVSRGVVVHLADHDPEQARTAAALGAGTADRSGTPERNGQARRARRRTRRPPPDISTGASHHAPEDPGDAVHRAVEGARLAPVAPTA
ncbi:3-hydroxyacyl-CoA dehydrogenase NAD-binding domain-containing protein, partial [Streptomyces prunicolor]|uniref:3-hydroxyacyl-CoA dehydrogenase NAD-binding domain-containing protein n=1 Tax=Streptomyces prunicolor TaxID=67348 RepID=UPI0033C6833A